jgi:hypothetical protein
VRHTVEMTADPCIARLNFYEKDIRCQGKSILGLGPFLFCSPDPASIRTFGEPLVWGSVLFEVQSVSRRCHLSLGVDAP